MEEENRKVCGHYPLKENKQCDVCGCPIGDYVIFRGITRCVGCWVEYEVTDGCI